MRDEFGIDPRVAEESDLRAPLSMGGSFARGIALSDRCVIVPLTMGASTLTRCSLRSPVFSALEFTPRNPERSQSRLKGLRNRVVAFGVVFVVVSSRPLHSAALRPRTRLGWWLMVVAVAHALLAGIVQAAAFFWDSLFGLIFGFLISAVVQVMLTPATMHRYLGPGLQGLLLLRASASSRRPVRTVLPRRRGASIAAVLTFDRSLRS